MRRVRRGPVGAHGRPGAGSGGARGRGRARGKGRKGAKAAASVAVYYGGGAAHWVSVSMFILTVPASMA